MKQVPLVGCSRCPRRWPLGGVVDAVHPVSGKRFPNHPMLSVLVDRKVVCYRCLLENDLRGKPLTADLYEAMKARPPKDAVLKPAAIEIPAVVVCVLPDEPVSPCEPAEPMWHEDPMPDIPLNPVLSTTAREMAKLSAIRRADNARQVEVGGRVVEVVACRTAGAFPRPALGSHWPQPSHPPPECVPVGSSTPAYVPPMIVGVIAEVLDDLREAEEARDTSVLLTKDRTIRVLDRFKGLEPTHTQALRRQIKRHKKRVDAL